MSFELSLPRPIRQALALAFLLVPLLVLGSALWSYGADALEHRERVALLLREKAEYDGVLQQEPQWDRQLMHLRHAMSGEKLIYTGKTVDADAKKLQMRLATLINAAGATGLRDQVTVGTSSADGPTEIHDDVTFAGTMAQIRTVLYQLKQSRPLLFAAHLAIHAASTDMSGRLQVELQVLGFASPA
jgi:hypothetical protein